MQWKSISCTALACCEIPRFRMYPCWWDPIKPGSSGEILHTITLASILYARDVIPRLWLHSGGVKFHLFWKVRKSTNYRLLLIVFTITLPYYKLGTVAQFHRSHEKKFPFLPLFFLFFIAPGPFSSFLLLPGLRPPEPRRSRYTQLVSPRDPACEAGVRCYMWSYLWKRNIKEELRR